MLVHPYIYSDQPWINSSIKVSLKQVFKYIKDKGFTWFVRWTQHWTRNCEIMYMQWDGHRSWSWSPSSAEPWSAVNALIPLYPVQLDTKSRSRSHRNVQNFLTKILSSHSDDLRLFSHPHDAWTQQGQRKLEKGSLVLCFHLASLAGQLFVSKVCQHPYISY